MKNLTLLTFFALLLWSNHLHAQWVQANTGLTINEVNSFAVIGTNLFAGTGNASGNGQGVFLSTDNGSTWTAVNNGLTNLNIKNIIAKDSILYAAIGATGFPFNGGIYKSTDLGNNWTAVNNGFTTAHATRIAAMGTTLYASVSGGGNYVYLSTDEGANWAVTPDATLIDVQVKSIIDDGTNLIVGSDANSRGVFYSTDNGTTWSNTSLQSETDQVIALGNSIFAATGIGVFKSTDHGVTWNPTTNVAGIIDNATALAVIGNCLLVATPGGRVFSSDDSGTTWNNVSTGASLSLSAEALGMDATYIYAGINFTSTGIWKRPISEFGCSVTGVEDLDNNSLVVLYPNPAQTLVTISNLPNGSTVKIFDLTGKTLYNSTINDNQITVHTADFANGVYLVQVSNNGSVVNKKLVINK